MQKVLTLTCGHYQKPFSTARIQVCSLRRNNKDERWIVTDFLFSESANWETVREVDLIHNPQNIVAHCHVHHYQKRFTLTQWPTLRCDQKTRPIQSCIVSMSWLFVDALSICISVQPTSKVPTFTLPDKTEFYISLFPAQYLLQLESIETQFLRKGSGQSIHWLVQYL